MAIHEPTDSHRTVTLRMEPLAPSTSDAILVGDPRRAFALAQAFTADPRMTHIARGLWGYLGRFGAGSLVVQSTGAGGGAAATIVSEMAGQGFRRMIRMGTCEAVDPELEIGEVLMIERAIGEDGATRTLASIPAGDPSPTIEPDGALARSLSAAGPSVQVTSRDLPSRIDPGPDPESEVRDLQSAAFLMTARLAGLQSAVLLVVAEDRSGRRLPEAGIEEAFAGLAGLLETALSRPNTKPQVES